MSQLNSETDFVARNEHFTRLATKLSATALATLPASGGPAAAAAAPTGCDALPEPAFAAWRDDTPLPGGDTLGGACSVAGGVTDLVAKIRENLVLRRGARLEVRGGLVVAYTHNAVAPGLGSIGVLVGLAPAGGAGAAPLTPGGTPGYAGLADAARRVAMHVAAARPLYLSRASVPAAAVERERAVLVEQAATSGKPAGIVAKMVEGRLGKFYGESVLGEQPYVLSEEGVRVGKWLDDAAKKAGAPPVVIAGFAHFVVGEGLPPAGGEAQ